MFERWTSMNGSAVARNASRIATLVWVNAPGLMMAQSTPSLEAWWIRSTRPCSALLWKQSRRCPVPFGERGKFRFDIRERRVAIDVRLTRAEQIQVGTVQQEQIGHPASLPMQWIRRSFMCRIMAVHSNSIQIREISAQISTDLSVARNPVERSREQRHDFFPEPAPGSAHQRNGPESGPPNPRMR